MSNESVPDSETAVSSGEDLSLTSTDSPERRIASLESQLAEEIATRTRARVRDRTIIMILALIVLVFVGTCAWLFFHIGHSLQKIR